MKYEMIFDFLASLCLQGYRVQSAGLKSSKRLMFELEPPDLRLRLFYFLAETETEKRR